jgi:hypothetical protein
MLAASLRSYNFPHPVACQRQPVFELPGGWGVEPPVVCLTAKQDVLGYPGGQFQPPPLLMMLNRLCVMTMTMNRQMSTPHLFFDNSNPEGNSNWCKNLAVFIQKVEFNILKRWKFEFSHYSLGKVFSRRRKYCHIMSSIVWHKALSNCNQRLQQLFLLILGVNPSSTMKSTYSSLYGLFYSKLWRIF